jgi:hypothetical protein
MYDAPQSEECERKNKLLGLQLSLGMAKAVCEEEKLRIRAQYEDKNFLELVGMGVIAKEKL